jgi:hypothetical protein
MIERLRDIVCGMHHAQGDEERRFLVLASKQRLKISLGLASKLVASGFPVRASKPAATFGRFGPQNHRDDSWFGP